MQRKIPFIANPMFPKSPLPTKKGKRAVTRKFVWELIPKLPE
jgi:hypothetical protein